MKKTARIHVAGAATLIGSAIVRRLRDAGYTSVSGEGPDRAKSVDAHFAEFRPEYVFYAAGKSGGIQTNIDFPAELMIDNLRSQMSVISAARDHGVKKLLYLASACVYPRLCPQPMAETSLSAGPLEPTNEAYATAKLAGIRLCQALRDQHGTNFISVIPTNVYGPGDHFDPADSHVIAALTHRIHEAKTRHVASVEIWGTGKPLREFMFVDDLAGACEFLMKEYDERLPINAGAGESVSIAELAKSLCEIIGYEGEIVYDATKPDGMPKKMLDSSRLLGMGWSSKVPLREGLETTYRWYVEHMVSGVPLQ